MVNLHFFLEDESLKEKLSDMIKENDFSFYRWQKKLVPEHIYQRNNNLISHVSPIGIDSADKDDSDNDVIVNNSSLENYYMKNMKIRYLIRKFICKVKTKIAKKKNYWERRFTNI